LDGALTDGLSQVAFAGAAWAEKQCILPLADEGACGQVEDQTPIHLRVESEIEVVQRFVRIAEGSLFAAPVQQSLGAPGQFVRDQTRDEIDRGHGLGLGLAQSSFQHGGHAAEPELA